MDGAFARPAVQPTSPLHVARLPFWTAREKLNWLAALKAELTAEDVDPAALAYDLDDVERAMAVVRAEALRGTAPAPLGRKPADDCR